MRALVILVLVSLLGAGAAWLAGRVSVTGRIQEVETELGQLGGARGGRMPEVADVEELLERLAAERGLELVPDSVDVTAVAVDPANPGAVPAHVRTALGAAQALAGAPGPEGPRFRTEGTRLAVEARLRGHRWLATVERRISRTVLIFGAP